MHNGPSRTMFSYRFRTQFVAGLQTPTIQLSHIFWQMRLPSSLLSAPMSTRTRQFYRFQRLEIVFGCSMINRIVNILSIVSLRQICFISNRSYFKNILEKKNSNYKKKSNERTFKMVFLFFIFHFIISRGLDLVDVCLPYVVPGLA